MEVTVNINSIPCGNGLEPEFLPSNSKGYLLNETTILPAEVILSIKAIGYMNTFYGGHVTVEPKHQSNSNENNNGNNSGNNNNGSNDTNNKDNNDNKDKNPIIIKQGSNQDESDAIRQLQYDFFIDGASIQDILLPLGVQTEWQLSDIDSNTTENQSSNTQNFTQASESKPITYYERNPGILNYIVTVPCRLEMTYLPPEEFEKLNQKISLPQEELNSVKVNENTLDNNNNNLNGNNMESQITVVNKDNNGVNTDEKINNTTENSSSNNNNTFSSTSNTNTNTTNINANTTIITTTAHNDTNNSTEISQEITQPQQNSAPVEKPPLLSKLRVLIVDDSPAIQKILGKWLLRNDCEVTSALNGQLGVEALQTADRVFDVVFMDFLMPVMVNFKIVNYSFIYSFN